MPRLATPKRQSEPEIYRDKAQGTAQRDQAAHACLAPHSQTLESFPYLTGVISSRLCLSSFPAATIYLYEKYICNFLRGLTGL